MSITEDERIWKFKSKTFFFILGCVISATFTLALIYFEFRDLQKQIVTLTQEDVKTNLRLDKITKRNKVEIDKLKEKGSDGIN